MTRLDTAHFQKQKNTEYPYRVNFILSYQAIAYITKNKYKLNIYKGIYIIKIIKITIINYLF